MLTEDALDRVGETVDRPRQLAIFFIFGDSAAQPPHVIGNYLDQYLEIKILLLKTPT